MCTPSRILYSSTELNSNDNVHAILFIERRKIWMRRWLIVINSLYSFSPTTIASFLSKTVWSKNKNCHTSLQSTNWRAYNTASVSVASASGETFRLGNHLVRVTVHTTIWSIEKGWQRHCALSGGNYTVERQRLFELVIRGNIRVWGVWHPR